MKNLQRRKSESNLKSKPTPRKVDPLGWINNPIRRGSISDIDSSDSQYPDIYKLIDEIRFAESQLTLTTREIVEFMDLLKLVQMIHSVLYEPISYSSYNLLKNSYAAAWRNDKSRWISEYLIECEKNKWDVSKCLTPKFYMKCIKYLVKNAQTIEQILLKNKKFNCQGDFLSSPECKFLMHLHKLALYIKDRQLHNDRIKAKKTVKHLPIPDIDAKKNIMSFF